MTCVIFFVSASTAASAFFNSAASLPIPAILWSKKASTSFSMDRSRDEIKGLLESVRDSLNVK